MKKQMLLASFLILTLITAGCSNQKNKNTGNDSGSAEENSSPASSVLDTSEIFSDRDFEIGYDEDESIAIRLNGDSADCSSDAVQLSDSTVTITKEGTYLLSGTLNDGMIIVNTDKSEKVQLVLDSVTIHSETSAAIYVLQSDKVFLTQTAGSTNTFSNGGTFTAIDENNIDAVIFSKDDLTLNGSGTMIITSPAGHGIVSKDSLKFTSGSYDINCASHAISGNDEVSVANADFTIVSGKDGIHAENTEDSSLGFSYIQSGTFQISAEGDGISASSCIQIDDGSFDITSGGGSVNAASHYSDAWGDFKGGGRHEGGPGRNTEGTPGSDPGTDTPNMGMPDKSISGTNDTATGISDAVTTNESDMPVDPENNSANSETSSEDSSSMKGIKAGAELSIYGGTFTIDSADDSFHSNGSMMIASGTYTVASGDDAFHADETLEVTDGSMNITECYEGLEGLEVNVSGGDITLIASNDGFNAAGGTDSSGSTGGRDGKITQQGAPGSDSSNGSITISGGTIHITASGDGIDSNGSLDIIGGNVTVCGPTQGDTATLDYDSSGTISGGTFIGTGASGMAQTFSSSSQGVIAVNVGNQSAGTEIQLADSNGNVIISYTPELDFAVVILSSPDILSGEDYTITVGSASDTFTAE